MDFFDPPPLRWTGAKWQLADWIIDKLPPHDIYVEPFAGSGAVFFRKHRAPIEVLNDRNDEIVNFFNVLRSRPHDMVRAIEMTPYSRTEYDQSYIITEDMDELERARRFYVRCWQSFGATSGRKTGWRTTKTVGWGYNPVEQFGRIDGLLKGAARLKEAFIENDDAFSIINRYDTDRTVFYIDPPYVLRSRSQGIGRKRYEFEMTDEDHRQLAAALHQVKGSVLLSGYDSPLYRELFGDWSVFSKTTTTNGNSTAIEYLWMNPRATSVHCLPLFESL